jgi:DNA-3-methyladenine glycosylase I
MDDDALEALRQNEGIVRNRLKIYSTRSNAAAVLAVQESHGSFAAYLWAFVDGQPVINQTASLSQVPASTSLSDDLSKDMKRRGFKFVGSTIIYAFMQGIGMVDDHVAGCWRRADSTA